MHFAISRVNFLNLVGGFCGKNPKNKSYRMPFNVKKCKLFHFSFPNFKHSDPPRGPINSGFTWNNLQKTPFLPNVYKCLRCLVGLAGWSTFAIANQGARRQNRS